MKWKLKKSVFDSLGIDCIEPSKEVKSGFKWAKQEQNDYSADAAIVSCGVLKMHAFGSVSLMRCVWNTW